MPKNYFRSTLIFLIFTELLSIFAWILPAFNLAVFSVILLITLILSLKKLEYGIFIAFTELIIGSHGYLFSFEYGTTLISMRIGIFMAVMLAWLIKVFKSGGLKNYWQQFREFKFFKHYLALAALLMWSLVWGIIRGNNFGYVFLDFNNWLFFLYLFPLITVSQKENFWQNFSQVALAALTWLIAKTIILLYIFSHQFMWALPETYRWIRDTRIGEITLISRNFHRIFIQSQIYALLGFFILLSTLNYKIKKPLITYCLPLSVCLAAVIISFSRSFWLGLIVGLFVYYLLLIIYWRKEFFKQLLKLMAVSLISLVIIFLIINLPPKISGANFGSLVSQRATKIEAAGSSRINMLKPLSKAISRHPVIGSGFGTTVTYFSLDPRVLSTTAGASGQYTTYAFEWAYFDLLLKIGLIGLVIYLLLIFKLLRSLWQEVNFKPRVSNFESHNKLKIKNPKLSLGIFLALISLLVVNIFTPYLNHPLGIGFVLIVSVFSSQNNFGIKN